MNLVRTARTDDRSATDYPSADPQAPRSFNQEPRVLKSISSPCLSVRGHVRTSRRSGSRSHSPVGAQMNLSGRAEFHVRMPMCGRSADGTLSIGGVVKLVRIVIVFDAADLNAESAFWAGRARPCARGMA